MSMHANEDVLSNAKISFYFIFFDFFFIFFWIFFVIISIRKTQQIEERQRRNIQKSRPYFEEKQLCQEQLETQKERIHELEIQIKSTKASYAMSLKNLEKISEEIHRTRGTDLGITPPGPREPGVGATDDDDYDDPSSSDTIKGGSGKNKLKNLPIADIMNQMENDNSLDATSLDTNSIFSEDKDDEDYAQSLDDTKRGLCAEGVGSSSMTTNSRNEPADATSGDVENHELNLEELRQKVKVLAVRPVEGGDGQQSFPDKDCWESELNETVNKLDRLMMLQENNTNARNVNSSPGENILNFQNCHTHFHGNLYSLILFLFFCLL